MNNPIYIYEICLNGFIVANSGNVKFKTEKNANEDSRLFLRNLIKNNLELRKFSIDDFDVKVYHIEEENFSNGW